MSLRWRRVLVVGCGILAGAVCAGAGFLSQDAVLHGPIVLLGTRPEPNAADWQYAVVAAAWGGSASGAILLVGWPRSFRLRGLGFAGLALLGGFLLVRWLGDDDDRFPIDETVRYEDAAEVLLEDIYDALPGLAGAGEDDVEFWVSADGEDDSSGDDCFTEYAAPTASASLTLGVRFEGVPANWSLVGPILERAGYVDKGSAPTLNSGEFVYSKYERDDGTVSLSLTTPCLPRD